MVVLSKLFNFEMVVIEEMQQIVLCYWFYVVCIVFERREEWMIEGGLEVVCEENWLVYYIVFLCDVGCCVLIFIVVDQKQIEVVYCIGVEVIELYIGVYCDFYVEGEFVKCDDELVCLIDMVSFVYSFGFEVYVGYGLMYDIVKLIVVLLEIMELNIGYFLIGEVIFCGFVLVIMEMC